jgi:hypothetical protein
MSDEVISDPVVEPEVKPEISPLAEETTPAPDQPTEPVAEQPAPEGGLNAGLENDVFKQRLGQVWARAKGAEAKADQLQAELQREREERIRYEERLRVQEETKKAAAEPEYTWEQLESFIAEGKITRAAANEYKEKKIEERAIKKAEERLEQKLTSTSKESVVHTELERYKKAAPEILSHGTEERQKVEREYAYLVNVLNYPKTFATELAATRAALGDLDTVERKAQAKRTATKEPFMETHSSTQKPQQKKNDPIAELEKDPRRKAHYEKLIRAGRYPKGWDSVREELEYKPRFARG